MSETRVLLRNIDEPGLNTIDVYERLSNEETPVAVVGSRAATPYAMDVAHRLGEELAENAFLDRQLGFRMHGDQLVGAAIQRDHGGRPRDRKDDDPLRRCQGRGFAAHPRG